MCSFPTADVQVTIQSCTLIRDKQKQFVVGVGVNVTGKRCYLGLAIVVKGLKNTCSDELPWHQLYD